MEAIVEEQPIPKRTSFWRRQWNDEPTTSQIVFDFIVGVIIPPMLLWFDPIVFRASCGQLFAEYAVFAYLAIGLGILTLALWLIARPVLNIVSPTVAGILSVGALFAVLLGLAMLPYTVIGLLFCVGALGFFPFMTAFVYARNAKRAIRAAFAQPLTRPVLTALMLLGILIVLGIPLIIAQTQVSQIITGDSIYSYACDSSD